MAGSDGAAAAPPRNPLAGVSILDVFESAAHDDVTGTLLRGVWRTRAEREIAAAVQSGRRPALLLFDVDHFKQCNDRFGHAAGDLVLAEVVWTIRRGLRHVDLIGRLGGDELVALLTDDHELAQAARIAERLRRRVEHLSVPVPTVRAAKLAGTRTGDADHRQTTEVTVSVGAAIGRPGSAPELSVLLEAADGAMYAAKAAGRNTVRAVETTADGVTGTPVAPTSTCQARSPW
ncbi:GGDEF domain-containing protein [Pseudonocardia sp. HH130630-07]|uniref:GGDEF domain-containing protein n=1 Tax=Pseudonocardia sp. HH130630-07 TaxID=1690815 RepID=UPI0018D48DE1|nr:GGDEF domain-containing protein [Pseudonocardia sp. HH130630-07]